MKKVAKLISKLKRNWNKLLSILSTYNITSWERQKFKKMNGTVGYRFSKWSYLRMKKMANYFKRKSNWYKLLSILGIYSKAGDGLYHKWQSKKAFTVSQQWSLIFIRTKFAKFWAFLQIQRRALGLHVLFPRLCVVVLWVMSSSSSS